MVRLDDTIYPGLDFSSNIVTVRDGGAEIMRNAVLIDQHDWLPGLCRRTYSIRTTVAPGVYQFISRPISNPFVLEISINHVRVSTRNR